MVEGIKSYDNEGKWILGDNEDPRTFLAHYYILNGNYRLKDESGFRYLAKIQNYGHISGKDQRLFLLKLEQLTEVSSSLENAQEVISSPLKPGGIDFRTMNYMVQPMGSFKDLRFMLPTLSSSALERIDLDQELVSLRDMVKAGMVPSGERVKEYLAACFQKGKIEEKQDDLLVCLAEIYRLAEEKNLETSPELRESLVIVDTGRFVLLPNNQMVGLN